ncbi:hypothetical protein M011DRAFT_486173 [Sporormia fimetaria CBS 119925]|uniref:Myb-like domain-containing protein n=1 Tax=Sporormia fimetaria CBS 119925 TaxID=1340428 RepID=A0A6A6VAZ0_9PLEO|nr:hypothetical protein M011DRAFT_486173 [Sporormia fimetaria CBS 119925]
MDQANHIPRKVSKAYLFGWSNKPFKDPKPPPPPPRPTTPMANPGALLEWVASDGRKGSSSKPLKISLTRGPLAASNLANLPAAPSNPAGDPGPQVPEAQAAPPAPPGSVAQPVPPAGAMAPAASPKDPLMDGLWAGLGPLVAPNTPVQAAPAVVVNVQATDSGFTPEQDAELLRRKNENETWQQIVEAMGKDKGQLTKRFNEIKPKDWRPNAKEKGGQNKGKNQEKKDEKDKSTNVNNTGGGQNAQNSSSKKGDNKGNGAGSNTTNGNGNENAGNGPAYGTVYPDETFSMDDLAVIAKILKRDHEHVWFRVSCAFKDKTGRHVPEEVFRDKLRGKSG